MSLVLAALLAASPVTASALPSCSWNQPGHNPFMGDVVAAVDRYGDIPPELRRRLKARMARRDYDEIVSIRRDSIVGQARYGAEIRDMHFGTGQVCGQVNRAAWGPEAQERGLVYCEGEHCILVPTVCRNVSRISRTSRPPGAVAGASAEQGATPLSSAQGPAAEAGGGAGAQGLTQAANAAPGPAAGPGPGQPVATASDLSGLPSLVGESAPAASAAATSGSAGVPANASGMSWLGSVDGGGVGLGAAGWASAAGLPTDRQVSALPGNTRNLLTDGSLPGVIDPVGAIPAVPEPAGVLLWLAGLAALLARVRRRRSAPGRAGKVNPG